ncbi:MAG: glycoside hydrolase family 32 protein [Lachnospiraceae bacterium]|nr:glycoside hydrolase family 32 protein [Lachnospiraceae bacterium]
MNTKKDPYRLKFHLMPPTGWMNDPNGLCEFKGKFHVFFQYSPDNPRGGAKYWGHYMGEDLMHLHFAGSPLAPDEAFDKNGVYSGSALTDGDKMLLYYTGNVKQAGEHDYTYSGREANTILVSSDDGENFSPKLKLMGNEDYPKEYTCHVRDPKVWKQNGRYYMVQGGRLNGSGSHVVQKPEAYNGDKGAVIIMAGDTPDTWRVIGNISTKEPFGYMWECPDYFEVSGTGIFSCSPQGLTDEEYRWQNIYQSGYFIMPDDYDITDETAGYRYIDDPADNFREWDMGFDFYAPQTFEDSKGRRLLIGWAGMPDADYGNEHTIAHLWQHALTVPREINVNDGVVTQWPVSELETLRGQKYETQEDKEVVELASRSADVIMEDITASGDILSLSDTSGKLFDIRLDRYEDHQILRLILSESAGEGRIERRIKLRSLNSLRLLLDTSLLELYINEGEEVMTSRFYAGEENAWEPYRLTVAHKGTIVYEMNEMNQ